MRRVDALPELLAPAGDFECLVAAVAAGADAVYVGGRFFGARAYAKNFDAAELARAAAYCHVHGVKLYVTLNTLVEDGELSDALAFAEELYRINVDALIIADLGLLSLIHRRLPDMELHASTQMSVHNTLGADAAYDLGCKRVVLARELTRENIRKVTEHSRAEIEVFVHGAICVSTSGQCLFSSLVGGRSGNRGECAQPCRLPYCGSYPLSMSDMSLAGHIRELIDLGVSSLKIEGRMKSPDYVYRVTSVYRRLLDEGRNSNRREDEELRRAFSRGGFTDGYFVGKTQSSSMLGVRSEDDKAASRGVVSEGYAPTRVEIGAKCVIKSGRPSTLTLSYTDGRQVSAVGPVPRAAINAPLTVGAVKARLSKMGSTFFSLPEDNFSLELDEGLNLSPAELNGLRRAASEALENYGFENRVLSVRDEGLLDELPRVDTLPRRTALFLNPEVLQRLSADIGFFDCTVIPLWRIEELKCSVNAVALPPTVGEDELDEVKRLLSVAKAKGIGYAMVGNLGHIELCKSLGFDMLGDFRLNVTNKYTAAVLTELGIKRVMLSPELNAPAARRIGGAVTVYGRIPLMLTERCFMRERVGCEKCSEAVLTDRRGVKFPMLREFSHRNLILNSAVTYMGDRQNELRGGIPLCQHFIFSTESAEQVRAVMRAFDVGGAFPLSEPMRRMGRRHNTAK